MIWIFVLAMASFGLLLMVRLVDIQLRQGESWRELADQNRWFDQIVPAERGVLLDRYGQPLTLNQKRYFKLKEPDVVWSAKEPLTRTAALEQLVSQNNSTTSAQTDASQPFFSPVTFTLSRLYPYGSTLAHVLGYVGQVTADDLKVNPRLPLAELIGRSGLEAKVNESVRGKTGWLHYEVNALGEKLRLLAEEPHQPGSSIQTTLDPFISQVAAQAMENKIGAVVVFDAQTGAILTTLSTPSFDPNVFQANADAIATAAGAVNRAKTIQGYLTSDAKPLFNRAISGEYPPGSIFKLITALAGLSEGKITPETTVEDTGVLKVGIYEYANWYYTQYGRTEGAIQLERAIARSNDIYFYKAAEAIGPTQLAAWARRFGLGQTIGIEVGGEAKGLVPDPVWKEKFTGEPWYLGNTYHFGIGQGDLLVTPVQVAQVVQAVSSRGRLCKLHLLAGQETDCHDLGLTLDELSAVRQGMIGACSPGGTAFPFFPVNQVALAAAASKSEDDQLRAGAVACKTGTAEFGAVLNAAGHRPTHGWFVLFADLSQPLQKALNNVGPEVNQSATPAATLVGRLTDHELWLQHVKQTGFPKEIGMVVLVESRPEFPFVEGSRDAGPVAKQIYDWMVSGTAIAKTAPAPAITPAVPAGFSE
jgi:penicillin-binding protein 2